MKYVGGDGIDRMLEAFNSANEANQILTTMDTWEYIRDICIGQEFPPYMIVERLKSREIPVPSKLLTDGSSAPGLVPAISKASEARTPRSRGVGLTDEKIFDPRMGSDSDNKTENSPPLPSAADSKLNKSLWARAQKTMQAAVRVNLTMKMNSDETMDGDASERQWQPELSILQKRADILRSLGLPEISAVGDEESETTKMQLKMVPPIPPAPAIAAQHQSAFPAAAKYAVFVVRLRLGVSIGRRSSTLCTMAGHLFRALVRAEGRAEPGGRRPSAAHWRVPQCDRAHAQAVWHRVPQG